MLLKLRLLLIVVFLFIIPVFQLNADEIIFTQLSINNGLSSNFVNCVGQSADGYIWVGTQNGLQRYDGYRFTQARRNVNKNRLPSLPVNQVIAAKNKQQLWLRMGSTIGLFNINDYSFTEIKVFGLKDIQERYEFKLITDRKGHMLLLVVNHGILVYNEQKKVFEKNEAVISYAENWQPTAIAEDKAGNFWIAGRAGLAYCDIKEKQFYTPAFNPKKLHALQLAKGITSVRNITLDSKNRIFLQSWPATSSYQAYLLDPQKAVPEKISYENDKTSNYYELREIVETNNMIWGYGNHAFNIFDENKRCFKRFYDHESVNYGIKVSQVYQLFADRDNNLWIASDNGLYIASILKNQIRNGTTPYFNGADVTTVKSLRNNRFFLGSWGSKIRILQYDKELNIKDDVATVDQIYKGAPIKKDDNYLKVWNGLELPERNEIWFGCQLGRLIRYHTVQKKSTFIYNPVFKNGTIRSMVLDSQKNLWFGLQNGLLIKDSGDNHFKVIADFEQASILKILVNKDNKLWVATSGKGIFYIDGVTGKILRNYKSGPQNKGLSTNHINDMVLVNDSLIAIACTANLNLLNPKTSHITQITAYDGLPHQSITTLQIDRQGFLWMSTIGGICRFDVNKRLFRMYDQKDGLLSTSNFAGLFENSTQLSNGYFVFASAKNFLIFNPSYLNRFVKPKNVIITDVRLFNSYLSVDSIQKKGGIRLSHKQNSISISFASLSYQQSNKLRYFYKLAGAGDNWYKAENGLSATFASLAPGDYTFMVRAQNSDGIFSSRITTLKINIIPAFWQTWWFVILIVLLCLLPIYFIYRLRLKRLIAIQKIREKVARDLHDDMGSTLTSINILSEMANTKVNAEPATVSDYLTRISKNSSQMMEAMDDIVWSIKPANDQLPRIVARMREYTANILEPQDIKYSFYSNENRGDIKLDMDERRNLFLIFKEALNNISKYAAAKKVTISLNYYKGFIILEIKDDGIGFDTNSKANGNGLSNMQTRTKLLNGEIKIVSVINQGTVVKIRLPLT